MKRLFATSKTQRRRKPCGQAGSSPRRRLDDSETTCRSVKSHMDDGRVELRLLSLRMSVLRAVPMAPISEGMAALRELFEASKMPRLRRWPIWEGMGAVNWLDWRRSLETLVRRPSSEGRGESRALAARLR